MTNSEQEDAVTLFVRRLAKLEPGERARLKRNAGRSLSESRDVMGLFFRLLPHGVPAYHEPWYFLLSTLFPLADGAATGNLGQALRRARNGQNSDGIDRRVEILLDSDEMQFPFRLRQAVHFLHGEGVGVEWEQLLRDLLRWTHPDRYVQQQWARAYFG